MCLYAILLSHSSRTSIMTHIHRGYDSYYDFSCALFLGFYLQFCNNNLSTYCKTASTTMTRRHYVPRLVEASKVILTVSSLVSAFCLRQGLMT